MSILNNNWFNLNSTRRYPIDDFATGESDEGFDLPNDIITDVRLRFPRSLCKYASISSITCGSKIVTVTIVGHDEHPSITNVSGGAENFQPLAVISLPKPITPNTPYQLKALSTGVFGWVVFGEGVEKTFSGRFSNADQALLSPRLAYSYGSYPVSSISTTDNSIKLTKDVVVRGIGDLKVTTETRTIKGIGTVKAFVFRLENTSTSQNLYEKYLGKCQGRPESESCNKISVEYINDMQPDCFGNIDINFTQNGIRQKELYNTQMVGIGLEMPLGMTEACTRDDYLPDQYGNLPNTYNDVCADVAAAEGDPDAIAGTDNQIQANPELSSEIVLTTALPYLDSMAYSSGSPIPAHIEIVKGSFDYETSSYNRGFPENYTNNGLVVRSSGSRFVAIWNDLAGYDHTYTVDSPTTTSGARASVTVVFKQLATQGSAGVILDFSTTYVASCDKYVKTYLLGVLDFSAKRIKILYWNGFSFLTLASSPVVPNLSPGSWYSLDFQKDVNDVVDGKVNYTLRLYNSEDYWTDLTSNSSLWLEVGSTPYPGYSVPLDDLTIESVSAYHANNDPNSYCGFGTVTGSPLFSYFFVG